MKKTEKTDTETMVQIRTERNHHKLRSHNHKSNREKKQVSVIKSNEKVVMDTINY